VKEIIMAAATNSTSCHWATRALAAPLHGLVAWYRISQERAALREMPDERLADIGITKRDVEWETRRHFWQ
jgi:uncharacterized protein YjiS (DUF1127 family)